MNREDIIRMAGEAGLVNWEATAYANELERFAALVASVEREKYEAIITNMTKLLEAQQNREGVAVDMIAAGIAAEREACIDLVAMYGGPVDLEAAIRARGQA